MMGNGGGSAVPAAELLAAAIVAFAACALLVPLAIRAGVRWKLLDEPDKRKHHEGAVPRTGGIALAGGLAAGVGAAFALGALPPASGSPGAALPFVAATAIVFAVGLLDDARGCSVGLKLTAQTSAAIIIVGAGHAVDVVTTPVGPLALGTTIGSIVTVVWLVGITNAINLMDGLDGLVGGISSIIAGSLAVFAWVQGDPATIAVALVLCGACFGFLPWNWRPARIFLGDGGALTIGFMLAWLALTASLKAATAMTVIVPILVLGVPAIDTLLVMGVRFLESPSGGLLSRVRRVVQADRSHLHHRILAVAEQRTVLLAMHGLVCAFCLLSLLAVVRNNFRLAVVTLLVQIAVVVLVRNVSTNRRGAGDGAAPGGANRRRAFAVDIEAGSRANRPARTRPPAGAPRSRTR